MTFLFLKSLHLIFMVAWFVGLFYLIRLFVYHVEAFEKSEQEQKILTAQYHIMETRLFQIIMRPAMTLTWIFGIALIFARGMDWFKINYWLHAKLVLVFLLSGYTEHAGKMISRLAKGEQVMSSDKMRLFNEIPTLFLVAIILLATYKNLLNFGYTFVGIVLFAIILALLTKAYKKHRLNKK